MRKRLLTVLFAFVMGLSMLPVYALAASASQFTDVPSQSWFYDDVDFTTRNGYYKGVTDSIFDPDGAMSRAMLATVLARYAGAAVDDSTSAFADVPAGFWYTGSIAWAQRNGIIEGCGDGTFRPDAPVTREEMAAIFVRFVTYYEKARSVKHRADGTVAQFTDAADIAVWALPAVQQCQVYGFIKGFDNGMYLPGRSCTRAQVAAVVHRLSWTAAGPVDPPPQGSGIYPEPVKEWTVTMHDGEDVTAVRVKDGESYELPVLQAENKAFKGWATSEDSKEIEYAPGAPIPEVTGDIEVWAVWAHIVTLHNEGEEDRTIEVMDDTLTAPAMPTDTKGGRVFMGWETEKDGTALYLPDATIDPIPTDLYAVWGWTVTLYHGEEICNDGGKAEVVRDGGEFTIPAPPASGQHQVFKGWSTKKDGPVDTSYQQGDKIEVKENITLYAIFADTFTVTVKNGTATVEQREVERGDAYIIPEAPASGGAHAGCHFMGWTDEEGGDVRAEYEAGETVVITQDLTLYAVWGHWVSVYSHNGTEAPVRTEHKDGSAYQAPAAPETVPAGKEFAGWAANEAGTEPETLYQPGDMVTGSISEDIELHAVWIDLFTVTYMDGTEAVRIDTGIKRGTTYHVEFDFDGLEPKGRVLMGWAVDEGLTEIVYTADGANTIEMTEDVTLYAVWGWTVKVFSHTTDAEGPDSETVVQAGKTFAVPEAPAKDGFRFKGWATNREGTEPDELYQPGGEPIAVNADIELHAIWAKVYTVTLMNGDKEHAKSGLLEAGESYTIGEEPAESGVDGHTGCVFMGWAETTDGAVKYITGSSVTVADQDITLWAVWGHTVTLYDKQQDGAWKAHEDGAVTVRHGTSYSIAADEHAPHDGDIFMGWATDETKDAAYSARVKYKTGETIDLTANVSLYAVWAHDYINQAIGDSTTWFNTNVKDKTNNAVDKLKKWINETLDGEPAVEGDFTDRFEVGTAVYDSDTRTVSVSFEAEADSDSALAVTKFAVRYVYALYDGSSMDLDQLKASLDALVLDILKDLGYKDADIDREKLDQFLDEMANELTQDLKGRWDNVDGKTCIDRMTVTAGMQPAVEISASDAAMDGVKRLAESLARDLLDSASTNTDWTSDMTLTSALKVEFTPAGEIAALYQTDAKEEDLFPTEYTVNVKLTVGSDYLAYKYNDANYVKITVPERVKDAYNTEMTALIDEIAVSQPVQEYLKEMSEKAEGAVKASGQYTQAADAFSILDSNFGLGTDMSTAFGTALHRWMAGNHLAPDADGKMDIMKSFLATGEEKDNTAFYEFVKTSSATARNAIKDKLDEQMRDVPNSGSVSAAFGSLTMGGYVRVTAQVPLDHNPYQLIMAAIKGDDDYDTKDHPENLIKNIQSAVSQIGTDLDKLERTYLTPKTGSNDSERYPEMDRLLTEAVKQQASYFLGNWNSEKNTGYIRLAVADAKEKVDSIREAISSIEELLGSLTIEDPDSTSTLLQPILTYFYADVVSIYTTESINEEAASEMEKAMDDFINSVIVPELDGLEACIAMLNGLKKYGEFDELWQTKPDDILTLLREEQVEKILSEKVLTEAVWAKIDAFVAKVEGRVDGIPDGTAISIKNVSFSKETLTSLLNGLKTAVSDKDYNALVTALDTLLGGLKDISMSDFTEEGQIMVTVSYGGHSVSFYLVLERAWAKTA